MERKTFKKCRWNGLRRIGEKTGNIHTHTHTNPFKMKVIRVHKPMSEQSVKLVVHRDREDHMVANEGQRHIERKAELERGKPGSRWCLLFQK